jgi:hypothetical protein
VQQSLIDREDTMNNTTTVRNQPTTHLVALALAALPRWMGLFRGDSSPTRRRHTRDTAATLYARAARYEATQPSFAADLRAAAEGLEQTVAERVR